MSPPALPPGPTTAHTSTGALAVSPHRLASEAAVAVMAAGGNAVDAAIAANAMLGTVLPNTCGPGGDLFALIHPPDADAPYALNASGRAGEGADAAALRAAGNEAMPLYGSWGITTPGCVDGWEAMLARFGALSFAEVLEPARRAALSFPASAELCAALTRGQQRLGGQAAAAALYPNGRPPRPGQELSRPDLARTWADLAEGGRDAFYGGEVGAGIIEASEGRISAQDLARRNADWVAPLSLDVFGLTAWTVPPNSQGYLVLAAAAVFAALDAPVDPADPGFAHAAIEAYRSVAWERDRLLADPDSSLVDPEDLIDARMLADRAGQIDPKQAGTWPAPAPTDGGTAYLCTVDPAGMGVSLIQSNFHGIGSGLGAGATGVFLHNRGAGFCLVPGHPNEFAPGKRPLHTLAPTTWSDDGRLAMLVGTRGGHQQPQLLLQAAAHRLHAGLSPAAALSEPRWTMDGFGAGSASAVEVEAGMSADAVAGLRDRGHEVTVREEAWIGGWGPISMIEVAGDGRRTGAADPRISTASAA